MNPDGASPRPIRGSHKISSTVAIGHSLAFGDTDC